MDRRQFLAALGITATTIAIPIPRLLAAPEPATDARLRAPASRRALAYSLCGFEASGAGEGQSTLHVSRGDQIVLSFYVASGGLMRWMPSQTQEIYFDSQPKVTVEGAPAVWQMYLADRELGLMSLVTGSGTGPGRMYSLRQTLPDGASET